MFAARLNRPAHRLLWVGYLVLALLVVQGLRVHFHTFADHEPLHGHDHAIELHVGGVPTDSGHDDLGSEVGVTQFTILKFKQFHADGLAVALTATALLLAFTGQAPWRPVRLTSPTPGSDVRTPPLRAPPV